MRIHLALAVATAVAGASSADALTAQDRYGPPRAREATPAALPALRVAALNRPESAYAAPLLDWASRRAAARSQSVQGAIPPAPAPISLAPPPQPPVVPTPAAVPAPPTQPIWTRPAATRWPSAANSPAPTQAPASPAPTPRAPDVVPAPAVRVAAAPSPPAGAASTRLYSLHREYGMAPDHLPEQPQRPHYVLIGPPDDATAPGRDQASAEDTEGNVR